MRQLIAFTSERLWASGTRMSIGHLLARTLIVSRVTVDSQGIYL
jgi:hypothetical protein